ncbi:TraY domain-containing protein [Vibrio cholerae]|nr:TraY domain-containing protein [Vibrio cholerae]
MSENKTESDDLSITVTLVLTGKDAKDFQTSAFRSGRSLRKEARFRMMDHIRRYSSLNRIGDCIARKASR